MRDGVIDLAEIKRNVDSTRSVEPFRMLMAFSLVSRDGFHTYEVR